MATRQLPDADLLRKLLRYDPETGNLYWRDRTPSMMADNQMIDAKVAASNWNNRFAGKPALSYIAPSGYRRGTLLCKTERAHRIIWKMMTGEEPNYIDHINGDRADNRWSNLRSVSKAENAMNVCLDPRNISGCPGVTRRADTQKWAARITIRGKLYQLGNYARLEDAIRVRKAAERKFGFHPNHGRRAGT